MSLVPIIFKSLLIVGGLFTAILLISFISYKLKGNKKKPYQEATNNVYQPKPQIKVVSHNEQKKKDYYRQEPQEKRYTKERLAIPENEDRYYASDVNYIREDKRSNNHPSRYEEESERIPSSNYNRTNESYNQQDFRQENIGRQRITNRPRLTVMTFNEPDVKPNSSYGGGNFNHFSANFDPLKYYQD